MQGSSGSGEREELIANDDETWREEKGVIQSAGYWLWIAVSTEKQKIIHNENKGSNSRTYTKKSRLIHRSKL